MSDDTDMPPPDDHRELVRRLEQSQRRLEAARDEFAQASTRQQQALEEVVDAFADISRLMQGVVRRTSPDARPPEPQPAGEQFAEESQPEASAPEPPDEAESPAPVVADQPENALPARLHSRGVPIPDQTDQPSEGEPADQPLDLGADDEPAAAMPPGVSARCPALVQLGEPETPEPFSGLDKERRIVLTNDGFGVAPALNEILSDRGYRVRIESRRPELSSPADTLIFLGSLRAPSDLDDAMAVIDDAVYAAEKMTTRLMQPGSGFVAAVDTGGGFGLDDFNPVTAPYGAMPGLVRLLNRRHPGAQTRLIDIDGSGMSGERIAELLADELLEGGDTTPVALQPQRRRTVQWKEFRSGAHPAGWLDENTPPLVYMPGADAVLATAVERLAIAHELPVAILRRRHTPTQIAKRFDELGIEVRSANYDLNRLFEAMDFLDAVRKHYGPIHAIVTESTPAKEPEQLARWEVIRPPLDEFNALLAMTINDPLKMLAVGVGPKTPPVIRSALRFFARAESLRRSDGLNVRLAHLRRRTPLGRSEEGFDPLDFALTEYLAAARPHSAEVRFENGER